MKEITALVLSYNEEQNIGRTISALHWVDKVVLVDSFSTDDTVEIARAMRPSIRIEQHAFISFAQQCNLGLSLTSTEWVLSIDADYVISEALASEINALVPENETSGYSACFRYCVYGHPLRSTLYPPRTVLYRRDVAAYKDEGHGHRVQIAGRVESLKNTIDHDDRKPLTRWVTAQDAYAKIEAVHLLVAPNEELPLQDRLRKRIFFAPAAVALLLLFGRGLILDGWPGWFYVSQRVIAELLLSMWLLLQRHGLQETHAPNKPVRIQ